MPGIAALVPEVQVEATFPDGTGDRPVQVGSHFHLPQADPAPWTRWDETDLPRARYAQLYGPTTGDRIRLADTDLVVEVTDDLCGGPGRAEDEPRSAVARCCASPWARAGPPAPRG